MRKSKQPSLVPGHYYHVYNRGNNGENLFIERRNFDYFLALYEKHVAPVADTFAYCLLQNHFHLLIRIKDRENLPGLEDLEGLNLRLHLPFSNFFNAYTKSINKAYHRTGSLFQKNFKRIPITSTAYLTRLVIYIHRNPQKHGLTEDFRNWPYSSFSQVLSSQESLVQKETILDWFGGIEIYTAAHTDNT